MRAKTFLPFKSFKSLTDILFIDKKSPYKFHSRIIIVIFLSIVNEMNEKLTAEKLLNNL